MKILVQEKNCLKLNFHTEGKLNAKDVENMPYVESVLPFQKEDAHTITYNWEGYISIVEYLNVKELQFEDTKGIFLSILTGFEQVQNAGGRLENIWDDVQYIYINPITTEIRFVYLPVEIDMNLDSHKNILQKIMFHMHTKNAEMVLGIVADILANAYRYDAFLPKLKEKLTVTSDNVKIVEKEVVVDRVVEKVIEKKVVESKKSGENLVVYTLLYTTLLVLLPMFLSNYVEEELMSKPGLLNICFCLFAILFSSIYTLGKEKKRMDDKMVVTLQPLKEEKKMEKK